MNPVCDVLGTLVEKGKGNFLTIAWGRIWNAAPVYILSSIPVINGIFITYKAWQVEDISYSSTLNVKQWKIFEFSYIAEYVVENTFFITSCILPMAIALREVGILEETKKHAYKWSKRILFLHDMRCFTISLTCFLAGSWYHNFVNSKLTAIKQACPKLETLNHHLCSATNLDEAKAIVEFFQNTYGSACQVNIHGIDNLEIVKYLVEEKGADVNGTVWHAHNGPITPLYYVNNLEVAQYLISKGADLYVLNRYSRTPLTSCAMFLLLKINSYNDSGISLPTDIKKAEKRMKILLACGADPNHKDGKGFSLYEIFELVKNPNFRTHFHKIYQLRDRGMNLSGHLSITLL